MGEANLDTTRHRADWNKNFDVLLDAYSRAAVDNGPGRITQ